MREYYLITFKNTHDAIASETFLRSKKINIDVMPTPVVITKSCGISIRFDMNDIDNFRLSMENNEFPFKNIYLRNKNGYKLVDVKERQINHE